MKLLPTICKVLWRGILQGFTPTPNYTWDWIPYDYNDPSTHPKETGKYICFRAYGRLPGDEIKLLQFVKGYGFRTNYAVKYILHLPPLPRGR